jgi:hypothetical protein
MCESVRRKSIGFESENVFVIFFSRWINFPSDSLEGKLMLVQVKQSIQQTKNPKGE